MKEFESYTKSLLVKIFKRYQRTATSAFCKQFSFDFLMQRHHLACYCAALECATWLPETREPEKKTRESRHRAGQV